MNIIEVYRSESLTNELIEALQKKLDIMRVDDISYGRSHRLDCSMRRTDLITLQNQINEIHPVLRRQDAEDKLVAANLQLKHAIDRKTKIIDRQKQGNIEPSDGLAIRLIDRDIAEKNKIVNRYTERLAVLHEIDHQESEHESLSFG